jgi:hypothetical protein
VDSIGSGAKIFSWAGFLSAEIFSSRLIKCSYVRNLHGNTLKPPVSSRLKCVEWSNVPMFPWKLHCISNCISLCILCAKKFFLTAANIFFLTSFFSLFSCVFKFLDLHGNMGTS